MLRRGALFFFSWSVVGPFMRIGVFESPYRSPPSSLLLRDQFLLQGVALCYLVRSTHLTDITYVQIFIVANFVIKSKCPA
jgi:hypothetical protein